MFDPPPGADDRTDSWHLSDLFPGIGAESTDPSTAGGPGGPVRWSYGTSGSRDDAMPGDVPGDVPTVPETPTLPLSAFPMEQQRRLVFLRWLYQHGAFGDDARPGDPGAGWSSL